MSKQPMSYAAACDIVDRRSNRICERCARGVLAGGHHHHRKLRSRGGLDCPSNLVFLCASCHSWVHANPALATARGWMLSRNSIPEVVPLADARYGEVYLGIDGQLYGRAPTDCIRAERAGRTDRHGWPLPATH